MEPSARIPLIAGNWKMYKTFEEARALAHGLKSALAELPLLVLGQAPPGPNAIEVVLFPSFPFLRPVDDASGVRIAVGAQNCHSEPEGAFTGEVSCEQLKSYDVRYVLIGHSERRQIFGERDEEINLKVRAALATGLRPVLCVGESLAEREEERTIAVVRGQLERGLEGLGADEVEPLVVAYEPVWAIGTGRTASPEQAQEVIAVIRAFLAERFGEERAAALRILYGGSVKAANAAALFAQKDIDGGLVGGASLKVEEFAAIARAAVRSEEVRA